VNVLEHFSEKLIFEKILNPLLAILIANSEGLAKLGRLRCDQSLLVSSLRGQ
jgi:hypothetical protein